MTRSKSETQGLDQAGSENYDCVKKNRIKCIYITLNFTLPWYGIGCIFGFSSIKRSLSRWILSLNSNGSIRNLFFKKTKIIWFIYYKMVLGSTMSISYLKYTIFAWKILLYINFVCVDIYIRYFQLEKNKVKILQLNKKKISIYDTITKNEEIDFYFSL